jgi:hypothetical protein
MSVLDPNQSSIIQFANVLINAGIIKQGEVILADVQHDEGCPALETLRTMDCRCHPDIVIGKKRYSFNPETGEVFVETDQNVN